MFHYFLLFHSDVWGLRFSIIKQGLYQYRYQSFRQENQSRLFHIFLDAPVCNEIRDYHMGIIHYAILSRNSSIGAIFTIYSRQKSRTYTCSISYIIFSDLLAHLMFHFLIISKTQSSSIYVFLVATTYSGFNLLSYLPISYKVNVHLHHNIINKLNFETAIKKTNENPNNMKILIWK